MSEIFQVKAPLPQSASELIRIAIRDLKKVERNKRYKIDMNEWHAPNLSEKGNLRFCEVCFAGSVMAETCGLKPKQDFRGLWENRDWQPLFAALNSFRTGSIYGGCHSLLKSHLRDRFRKFFVDGGMGADITSTSEFGKFQRAIKARWRKKGLTVDACGDSIYPYSANPRMFYSAMRVIAAAFKKEGL